MLVAVIKDGEGLHGEKNTVPTCSFGNLRAQSSSQGVSNLYALWSCSPNDIKEDRKQFASTKKTKHGVSGNDHEVKG